MQLASHDSHLQQLIERPYDEAILRSVYIAVGKDPRSYAALLVEAAEHTDENVPASHWLTEAARVKLHALREERDGVRLLEAALERDPLNLRAAEHMLELYRTRQKDQELGRLLKARADRMRQRYRAEPVTSPNAAVAFERLSGVYEAIGDASCALEALRTALELERARARSTAPSPPPAPPSEAFLAPTESMTATDALPPEPRWSDAPPGRDTIRSPVPVALELPEPSSRSGDGGPFGPLTSPPSITPTAPPTPQIDPLLSIIEALHSLRRIDDVVEGAELVLRTALAAIPSTAGLIHVADVTSRDFVLVAAEGARKAELLGLRTAESDALVELALRDTGAIVVDGSAPELRGARFALARPERSVLCAPAQFDGRRFGVIELVDAEDRETFTAADRHAMTYVGERFAEFLADRSIAF